MPKRHVRDPNASARSRRNSDLMAGQTGEFETISVTGGVVEVGRTLPPRDKVDKLYNEDGDLHWNGIDLTFTGHPAVDAATSVDQGGRFYIQDVTLDSFGHVIGLRPVEETVTATSVFTGLTDTPSSYDSKSLQLLRVNVGSGGDGTAIEFTDEVDGGAI